MIPLSFMALILTGFITTHTNMHLISAGIIEIPIIVSLLAADLLVILGHSLFLKKVVTWTVTGFAAVHASLTHSLTV